MKFGKQNLRLLGGLLFLVMISSESYGESLTQEAPPEKLSETPQEKPPENLQSKDVKNKIAINGFLTHKELTELAQPRVRIGLRLTSFIKKPTLDPQGKTIETYVTREPMRHTLRSRLNKVNHFYLGPWHVETTPQRWIKESRRYDIRLSLYRRFGAYDRLEELVGHVDLSGVLEKQEDTIYVLKGVTRQRIRDKFGFPLLDVVAGYEPEGVTSSYVVKPSPNRPSGKG